LIIIVSFIYSKYKKKAALVRVLQGEREEFGKEWKKNGRIEKSVIPILLIQLVTICNRLIH
jgi:hypothetical protein